MSAPLPHDLNQVDPKAAWQPWTPHAAQPFDAKLAGHLFRRAAFGAGPDEVRNAVRDGFDVTVQRLVAGDDRADGRLTFLDDIGDQIARVDDPDGLRAWWLYAMLNSGHPLREKMVLFWHGHFATSIAKVRSTSSMFRQNQILRRHALGKFAPLLADISRDPAMLVWLDSNQNVKSHPNENYAREVMELFTLGVGNFTELDVREAARAFTGRHVNGDDDQSELNLGEHDDGPKTFLKQSGKWDGDDVLRILLEQSACPRFLVSKLYRFFVSESEPPKALLEPLAEQLRKSEYDVGTVVRTILRSRLFFSEYALHKRIKSPVEYVLGAVRAAWPGPVAPTELVGPLGSMGQSLFAPPNVKGWTGGKNWLTDATLLARHKFAEKLVGEFPAPAPAIPTLPESVPAVPTLPDLPKVPSPPAKDEPPERSGLSSGTTVATSFWDVEGNSPATPLSNTNVAWYVRKMKARTPAAIVKTIGEQFFPEGLSERARIKLEAFMEIGSEHPATTGRADETKDLLHRAREAYDAQDYGLARKLAEKARGLRGDSPTEEPIEERIREAIHAVMCLPEYQLC